jgi:hypothetical protein
VKSSLTRRLRFARLLVLANSIFWLIFAINFAAKSYTYRPHVRAFEEVSAYIFWSRAFPMDQLASPLMRVTRFVQWPSFYAAGRLFFVHRDIDVSRIYWGISLGGYYLILVCLLSFLQWYLLGLLIDYARRRMNAGRIRAPGGPGRPYDAGP